MRWRSIRAPRPSISRCSRVVLKRATRSSPLTTGVPVDTGTVHARHLYPVLLDQAAAGISRDTLHARLRAHGISTSVHFRAVHLHPYYQERFGFRRGMFPIAESVSDTTLSLPLSAAMTETAVDRVIEAGHDVLR